MEAREHHYLFAHRILPLLFYKDSLAFIQISSTDGQKFAEHIWDDCAKNFLEDNSQYLSNNGLKIVPFESELFVGVIYVMPEAMGIPEVIMACAIGKKAKSFFGRAKIKNPRYFTLEKGQDEDGKETTFFCMWDNKGEHLNFGHGPIPIVESFEQFCIEAALQQKLDSNYISKSSF